MMKVMSLLSMATREPETLVVRSCLGATPEISKTSVKVMSAALADAVKQIAKTSLAGTAITCSLAQFRTS